MSTTLSVSEAQIDALAEKLDAMDLSVEEQAALVAVLGAGERPADGGDAQNGDWQLPTPGDGLRNAFTAGRGDEVSGFAASASSVSVSVGWSALA